MPKTYKGLFKLFLILSIFTFLLYRLPFPVQSAATYPVISEVQIAGDGADPGNDEFVELYNPTNSDVAMASWALKRKNSSGTEENLVDTLNGTIPAHGYFLIGHGTGYNGTPSLDVNYSAPSNALTNNYTVLLYNDSDVLVDKVGFGTANDFETATFGQNPAANGSIERKSDSSGVVENGGNGEDSNNNSQDFSLRDVSDPQNTDSDPELPPTPTPTESPTSTPTASPTDTPSPSPEESPSPSPSPTETATPTATPTESPTPTPTPASTATVEPTATPTETPEPTPTPTPKIIGVFRFPGKTTTCSITYEARTVWFLKFIFPKITCD